jgi:molybdopterin-guanine dinucleotide biosynthesis protein A
LALRLRKALEAGRFKVMAALQQEASDPPAADSETPSNSQALRVEMWNVAAFAAALPSAPDPHEWFLNINTPQDWRQAQQLRVK